MSKNVANRERSVFRLSEQRLSPAASHPGCRSQSVPSQALAVVDYLVRDGAYRNHRLPQAGLAERRVGSLSNQATISPGASRMTQCVLLTQIVALHPIGHAQVLRGRNTSVSKARNPVLQRSGRGSVINCELLIDVPHRRLRGRSVRFQKTFVSEQRAPATTQLLLPRTQPLLLSHVTSVNR
jgi:hypothetical protein